MPNIIEQQDLLKGLTDQRLAMLMQQPNEAIPPFLVAAEAQRRQAIRAQFGGGAQNNESVVDSLARQLARTPQNVNANPPAPPAPPPQQMGIAGLQPHGMANGGPVRRFNTLGYVAPTSLPLNPQVDARTQEVADQFGVSLDEARKMISNNPSVAGKEAATPGLPFKISEQNQEAYADPIELRLRGINESLAQAAERDKEAIRNAKYEEMYTYPGYESPVKKPSAANTPVSNASPAMTPPAPPTETPRDPNAGKDDTSAENKYKDQRNDFRSRYEALLSGNEPSSWERAQKFFDASQAFFQPNATTGEMIADALGAFGTGMAQEKAAAREADRALQEGLLNLDIQYAQEDRAAEIDAANRARDRAEKLQDVQSQRDYDTAKARILGAEGGVREFGRQIDDIDAQLNGTGAYTGVILSDADRAALIEKRKDYLNRISTIMNQSGYGITLTREQIEEAIRTGK